MYDEIPKEHCHVFDFDTEVPIEGPIKQDEDKDTDVPDHLVREQEENSPSKDKKVKAPKTKIVHYHHRFIKQEYLKKTNKILEI